MPHRKGNMMDILNSILAAPKTHAVVTTYDCGKVRRFEAHSHAAAVNYAFRERRKIGRKLIDRATGANVEVVSVEIEVIS